MSKKVTVITTTYQDLEHLKKVMESLKSQDYDNLEYIVVDGGSKDGTLDYLTDQRKYFDKRGWSYTFCSGKDEGIYDAIDKGIELAKGDIIGFLFDCFACGDALSRMIAAMEKEDADGVHADLDYIDEEGKLVRHWEMKNSGKLEEGWMPAHPTMYLKKEIYDQYGVYKINYRIAADYEFMVRIFKDRRVKLAYIPEVLIHMFYGGTSTSGAESYIRSFMESMRALKENKVPHRFKICLVRIFRVASQFYIQEEEIENMKKREALRLEELKKLKEREAAEKEEV